MWPRMQFQKLFEMYGLHKVEMPSFHCTSWYLEHDFRFVLSVVTLTEWWLSPCNGHPCNGHPCNGHPCNGHPCNSTNCLRGNNRFLFNQPLVTSELVNYLLFFFHFFSRSLSVSLLRQGSKFAYQSVSWKAHCCITRLATGEMGSLLQK